MKYVKKGNRKTKQRNEYKQQTMKEKERKEETKSLINYIRSSNEEGRKITLFSCYVILHNRSIQTF